MFVTSDMQANFLFHNGGSGKFEGVAFAAGVATTDDGKPASAMGLDFRCIDNDGLPDIVFTALTSETFPIFRNPGKGEFRDAGFTSGLGSVRRSLRVGA